MKRCFTSFHSLRFMMANVAVLLAPGFEEAEAIITIDILRRL